MSEQAVRTFIKQYPWPDLSEPQPWPSRQAKYEAERQEWRVVVEDMFKRV